MVEGDSLRVSLDGSANHISSVVPGTKAQVCSDGSNLSVIEGCGGALTGWRSPYQNWSSPSPQKGKDGDGSPLPYGERNATSVGNDLPKKGSFRASIADMVTVALASNTSSDGDWNILPSWFRGPAFADTDLPKMESSPALIDVVPDVAGITSSVDPSVAAATVVVDNIETVSSDLQVSDPPCSFTIRSKIGVRTPSSGLGTVKMGYGKNKGKFRGADIAGSGLPVKVAGTDVPGVVGFSYSDNAKFGIT